MVEGPKDSATVKDVVYISWMPLSEKVERDWYVTHLLEHEVRVEFWDVGPLFFEPDQFGRSVERSFVKKIGNWQQLKKNVVGKPVASTNFVLLFNYEPRFFRLFRILSSHGCRLYFFEWGNFPIKPRGATTRYLSSLAHPVRILKKIYGKLLSAAAFKLKLLKPFDVVFAAGYVSLGMHPDAGQLIPVNLCDYDINAVVSGANRRLIEDRYCVFLDNNLAFHTDFQVVGLDNVSASAYAASLTRFFSIIQEKFKVKVVVAAHPKADYGVTYFGCQALKGVTAELVCDAEFVISHHSTAISYAILNKKPLLFIYTEEMARIYRDNIVAWIGDFAEYLNQPLFNTDRVKLSEIEVLEPDLERYDLYKYNYLTTPESEHRLTRDIFFDAVTADCNKDLP